VRARAKVTIVYKKSTGSEMNDLLTFV